MTTVETRVVDPVSSRTGNGVDVTESEMVEAALGREEEDKMLEDEEIDSCEAEDLEDQMLTVALVKSVVDSGGHKVQQHGAPQSPRSAALRKRRRPGDSTGESYGKPTVAPSAPVSAPTAMICNGRLNLLPVAPVSKVTVQVDGMKHVRPSKPPEPTLSTSSTTKHPTTKGGTSSASSREPIISKPLAASSSHQTNLQPIGIKAESTPMSRGMPLSQPVVVGQKSKSKGAKTTSSKRRASHVPIKKKVQKVSPSPQSGGSALVATSGAVPNPLLHSTPPPQPVRAAPKPAIRSAAPAPAVPCPLPPAVPCPLQAEPVEVPSEKRVTISEPPVSASRSRVFSVDLDPSTFDFSGMAGDHSDMSKDDPETSEIGGGATADDLTLFRRDRAFSFEFFSFAGDDLLPAPPAPTAATTALPEPTALVDTPMTRPRGDSIIFDPASFQDGGIHEKNAIMKVNAAKQLETTPPSLLADPGLAVPNQARSSSMKPMIPGRSVPMSSTEPNLVVDSTDIDNGQLATLPSGLTMGNANGNTPATFQMELLNKDGRIGIYLPEARRARIARFHAKRKMRIWRKRIKYDCRKKLADSRPRIKGRFVKRSDMDE